MSVQLINEILRDFERYTGDGKPNEPVGHPLPIGDPRTGIHNPGKYWLRELLLSILQAQGDPQALQELIEKIRVKTQIFASRDAAIAKGQEELPAAIERISTIENGSIVVRGPNHNGDDPLFATAPFWGVINRYTASRLVAAETGVVRLENVAGTADAITADWPTYTPVNTLSTGLAFGFFPTAANTVEEPTITLKDVDGNDETIALKDTDGTPLPAEALDPRRFFAFIKTAQAQARLWSFPISLKELLTLLTPVYEIASQDDLSTATTTTGMGNANVAVQGAITAGGTVTRLKVFAVMDGPVTVRSWTSPDAVNFTIHEQQTVQVRAGYGEYPVIVRVPVGGYAGFTGAGVVGLEANPPFTPWNFYAGGSFENPDFADSNGPSGNPFTATLEISREITPSLSQVAGPDTAGDLDTLREGLLVDQQVDRGAPDDLSAASATIGIGAANYAASEPVKGTGTITTVKLWALAAGNAIIRSWSSPDASSFTMHAEQSISVTAGYGEYPVMVAVPVGGYVGFHAPGVVAVQATNVTAWTFYAGGNASQPNFTDADGTTSNRLTISFVIESRVLKSNALNTTSLTPVRFNMVGGQGQSNMWGAPVTIGLSNRQRYGALGFMNKQTDLVPLTAAATNPNGSEWPGMGFALALREGLMFQGGTAPTLAGEGLIVGHSARGGTAIADLGPGSLEYDTAQAQIVAAADHARAKSATLAYWGSMWVQGERDMVVGTPGATYRNALMALAEAHDRDARVSLAEFGSARPYPLFVTQITSGLPYAASPEAAWAIPKAQLEASDLSPLVQIVGPMYMVPFAENNHVTGEGSRMLGAYNARAVRHWLSYGTPYAPLRAVEWWAQGSEIRIQYSRQGLALDDTWQVPAQPQNGFRVYDAGGADVAITGFAIVAPNELRLTCASAPTSGWRWTYGEGAAVGLAPYAGGAGNLRDSAGDDDVWFGVPLHNAALMQEGVI